MIGENGNIKVRWFFIVFGTASVAIGAMLWLQAQFSLKADAVTVAKIEARQEVYNKDIQEIRERLVRIELKLEKEK